MIPSLQNSSELKLPRLNSSSLSSPSAASSVLFFDERKEMTENVKPTVESESVLKTPSGLKSILIKEEKSSPPVVIRAYADSSPLSIQSVVESKAYPTPLNVKSKDFDFELLNTSNSNLDLVIENSSFNPQSSFHNARAELTRNLTLYKGPSCLNEITLLNSGNSVTTSCSFKSSKNLKTKKEDLFFEIHYTASKTTGPLTDLCSTYNPEIPIRQIQKEQFLINENNILQLVNRKIVSNNPKVVTTQHQNPLYCSLSFTKTPPSTMLLLCSSLFLVFPFVLKNTFNTILLNYFKNK